MDGANGFFLGGEDLFSRIPLPTSELHVCPHTKRERKRNGGGGEVNAAKDLLSLALGRKKKERGGKSGFCVFSEMSPFAPFLSCPSKPVTPGMKMQGFS